MLTNIPRTEKACECGCNDFNQAKDFRPNGSFLFFILHDDFGFRVKLKVIWARSEPGWWLRGGSVVAPWWLRGGSVVAPWWLRGGSEVARKSLGSRSVSWVYLNVGKGTNKG